MDEQLEYILRTIEEKNIRFVRMWFTDVLGILKSVSIPVAELVDAFENGIQFDGSAIQGFSRIVESDAIAKPDLSTFQIFPWLDEKGENYSARFFCDIYNTNGVPAFSDPRNVLRKQVEKAAKMGFSTYINPEIEYFVMEKFPPKNEIPVPIDVGGYFDLASHSSAPTLRRLSIQTLEAMGISVAMSHHDTAPGQQEIDLKFTDAITMADNIMTLRYVIKEVAILQGAYATFMPKPFKKYAGSGMHSHLSLFKGDVNAFYNSKEKYNLTSTAKSFIAGILTHANEISAVTNQWVNSYKRIVNGKEAPNTATWGISNRSAMIRVPGYMPSNQNTPQGIEIRTPDSACNPYLAFAVILAAGLKGIEENYELASPAEDNIWDLSPEDRKKMGYKELPMNLSDAISHLENSKLMKEALGDYAFEYIITNKKLEWKRYSTKITPFELNNYLKL